MTGKRMRIWRIVLVLAGLAIAVLGAGIMLDTVSWRKLLGLAAWLAAAIVIHDGIIAPARPGALQTKWLGTIEVTA